MAALAAGVSSNVNLGYLGRGTLESRDFSYSRSKGNAADEKSERQNSVERQLPPHC